MPLAAVKNFPAKTPLVYKKLVADITRLYANARKTMVSAYWQTGRRIVEVEQDGAVRARYGETLLQNLSDDLSRRLGSGFSVENLRKMRRVYLESPIQPTSAELTWSQQVELLPVRQEKLRDQLEKRALREGLTSREIRALVRAEARRADRRENLSAPAVRTPLAPIKGKSGIYRIVSAKGKLQWDRGFSSFRELSTREARKFNAGDFVRMNGRLLQKAAGAKSADLYTYEVELDRVIDADTFWMKVWTAAPDWRREKLRLRGIDAPELSTQEGIEAKRFVEGLFKKAEAVTVTTTKPDKYHRYLSDVYLLMPDGEEIFLNNRLLETSRARRTDKIPVSEWEKE